MSTYQITQKVLFVLFLIKLYMIDFAIKSKKKKLKEIYSFDKIGGCNHGNCFNKVNFKSTRNEKFKPNLRM